MWAPGEWTCSQIRAWRELRGMKHLVIYRWRIKEGREDEFREAWAEGTRLIQERCGSGGAELFAGSDGTYFSLARWPSPVVRSECVKLPWPEQDDAWARTMLECYEERLPEIPLNRLRDLRKSDKAFHAVPTLQTERLTLRPLSLDDAEALFPALSDASNMRYWSRGPIESVAAVREYITYNVSPLGIECFAITETGATKKALGWVILIDRNPGQAEVGYILRPDAQGRGIAREAVSRALEHGFGSRGLRRIYADIDPDNERSIESVKALGFQYEGRLRATWETHLGLRDSVIYARLATDEV